jgi:hypothetical protein
VFVVRDRSSNGNLIWHLHRINTAAAAAVFEQQETSADVVNKSEVSVGEIDRRGSAHLCCMLRATAQISLRRQAPCSVSLSVPRIQQLLLCYCGSCPYLHSAIDWPMSAVGSGQFKARPRDVCPAMSIVSIGNARCSMHPVRPCSGVHRMSFRRMLIPVLVLG